MASRELSSSIWGLVGNWGQQVAAVGVFLYLVRVLDAADFGIMALAAAFVDVLSVVGRFGQVEALLQRKRVSDRTASTSFWLLLGVGCISLVLLAVFSSVLAWVFSDPRLGTILLILSPVPLIFNITQVQEYILRRSFEFKYIALRNVFATGAGGLAAVYAAYTGYGFYALVIQKLVSTTVYSLCLAASVQWKPRLQFSVSSFSALMRSGGNVVAANVINMLNPRIVDLFVGYYLGVAVLGNLRIAWRLFDLMIQVTYQPIVAVSISSFTSLRGNIEELRQSFYTYNNVLIMICVPLFVGTALTAGSVIQITVGGKWLPAVSYLQYLCLGAIGLSINFLFAPYMIGLRRTSTIRNQAVAQAIVTSATMFLTAQISITMVLVVHLMRIYLFGAANIFAMRRYGGISFTKTLAASFPPVVASLGMAAPVLAIDHYLAGSVPMLLEMGCKIGAGLTCYAAVILLGERFRLWPHYTASVRMVLGKFGRRRHPDHATVS